ncbi:MAG: AAA family ATPase [Roseibium sp.]
MIFVDRGTVVNPLRPGTPAGQEAADQYVSNKELIEQIERDGQVQRRTQATAYRHSTVRAALENVFKNKCAYCEMDLNGKESYIAHYRPWRSVVEAPDHPGYWWLANDWNNLLLVCTGCDQSLGSSRREKGTRFPLKNEDNRARHPDDPLDLEEPLVFDPTKEGDFADDELVFDTDGFVDSATDRGNATISLLNLNRRELYKSRWDAINRFLDFFDEDYERQKTSGSIDFQTAISFLEEGPAHSAFLKQLYNAIFDVIQNPKSKFSDGFEKITPIEIKSGEPEKFGEAGQESHDFLALPSPLLKRGGAKQNILPRYIEEIHIENIRSIEGISLLLDREGVGAVPWQIILGDNGHGKSTILQAIALVLAGPKLLKKLIDTVEFKPQNLIRQGADFGTIALSLKNQIGLHKLKIDMDGQCTFIHPSLGDRTFAFSTEIDETASDDLATWPEPPNLLALGPTRLLLIEIPSMGHDQDLSAINSGCFIDNLFNPFVPLIDGSNWCLGLDDEAFNRVALVLKDLLFLTDGVGNREVEIQRNDNGEILICENNNKINLNDHSSGYKSMVSVALEILKLLHTSWPNKDHAEGIVLIDEIDAHLHPRWQMRVMDSLKNAFPALQFIVTTHQPLCLRGMKGSAIVALKKNRAGKIIAFDQLPDPDSMPVEHLLTSDFFGLNSTDSPATDKQFEEYYGLQARENLSDAEEERLDKLGDALANHFLPGDDEAGRQYYRAINRLVADRRARLQLPEDRLNEEAYAAVRKIWEDFVSESRESQQ